MENDIITSQSIIKEQKDENMTRMNANDDSIKFKMLNSDVFKFRTEIIWFNVFKIFLFHAVGIYGLLTLNYLQNPLTLFWCFVMHIISNLGVSGGAHRLWSHRSYKAKLPLRILLLICYSTTGQHSLYKWVKMHRMHHKYCDTDADPNNTSRGFFFAHVGWIMMEEHPECTKKYDQIDLSDILSDPVVVFDERYCFLLQLFFTFILPTAIPIYLWNESWDRAILSQITRYMVSINSIWTINSVAHAFGTKPYDKNMRPTNNNFVNLFAIGEGYHNFHHVFPWDYRSSEKGNNKVNYTTYFIDFCAKLGLAYDLKYPSEDLIRSVVLKRGDGTHPLYEVPRQSD